MPILGIMASQISGHLWAPAGAYDSLATVTVPSGGAASISFAGIPSGYTHLQIRWTSVAAAAVNYQMRFNSDSTTSYAIHSLYGNGTSAAASSATSTTALQMPYQSTQSGSAIVDILDAFSIVKNKTIRSLGGADTNGGGLIDYSSGVWMKTLAINSIVLTSTQTIAQYSSFSLYGVK